MSVYQVSGETISFTGNGVTQSNTIPAATSINNITGARGPIFVKFGNTSDTDAATFEWVAASAAPEYDFNALSGTASASGQNQEFDVNVSYANGYTVTMTNAGDSFIPTETITILGTDVGGATPANDITITVVTAGDLDTVASLDNSSLVPGTGYSNATGVATTASIAGTGLTVDITTTAGAVDTVAINAPGEGYAVAEVITITGGNADATIDVLTVNAGGAILTYSVAGTDLWPQSGLGNSTVVMPLSTDFVQLLADPAVDTIVTGDCASGNMYVTPVNII